MYPKQSRPVNRPHVPPYFEDPAYLITHTAQLPRLDPRTGQPVTVEPLLLLIPIDVLGEVVDCNHAQRFREPIVCQDWCGLFSGFSMVSCLSMCR